MYVALVQQGMVLNQKAIATGSDEAELLTQAQAAADELNSQATSEQEGWTAVVISIDQESA